MKNPFLLLVLFFTSITMNTYADDCNNGRYIQQVFNRVDITKDVKYARKKQSDGQYIDLKYDVYQPHGDTLAQRPIMLLIHGGAYLKLLDHNSPDIVLMCDYFAKRGYVTVSIDYRQEPNLLGLLSEEVMVKAVSRALIDTKEAVDHLMLTYQNGNPYRIDTSRAFIGGVSAGAVSSMFISYLDSIQQLPAQYQQWIVEANGDSADYILRHKFDLVKPKACISVSGAILDTNWINKNGIDMLIIHGSADEIVPYNYGNPFHIPTLPVLFGGKAQYPVMLRKGIRVEFEDWIGRGHVPFMNLTFPDIIFNFINQPILDSTERHIAHFIYPWLNCNRTTHIKQNLMQEKLAIFPNPSNGQFSIPIPKSASYQNWKVEIYDLIGQQIFQQAVAYPTDFITINTTLAAGNYFVKMFYEQNNENIVYSGKITITQ
ncbi:MAG: T9SS type A sorting domain-containing protein [Chitinophagales bacterium]